MAVEDHPLFDDWGAAYDKLEIALMRHNAAKKAGHHLIMKAAESRLREAEKTYNDILAKL